MDQPSIVKRPLFSSRPAAGFPAPGDDMVEKALDLNEFLIDNPITTFFVRADGDSMEGAHIFSGDILVVDKARTPASGDIVVAAVYGELVVKRWVNRHGRGELVSENSQYEPIVVLDADDVFVWGVVVASVRRFL
jgi:DNA polymerase V